MITIDLSGKNALVTGGTRGIGRAITHRLAEAGASTSAVYRTDEAAAQLSRHERATYSTGTHRNYKADVGDAGQINSLAQQVVQDFDGVLDILVLNAGVGARGKVGEINPADWQRAIDVNLTGAFLLTQAVLPAMPRGSSIVSVASGAGHEALPGGMAAYAASKAGLILFTLDLAQDVGPQGIRANVVSPGFTDTSFGGAPASEERRTRASENTALRRVGVPDDIAYVVLFLCSDLAGFVTGQAIRVNGGVV